MRKSIPCFLLLTFTTASGCDNQDPLPRQQWEDQVSQTEITPQITQEEQAKIDAEVARWEKIERARHSDPKLNWLQIGISTGKFSETISSRVFKTYDECEASSLLEDWTCAPIAALPKSYWDAEQDTPDAT